MTSFADKISLQIDFYGVQLCGLHHCAIAILFAVIGWTTYLLPQTYHMEDLTWMQ